MSKPTWKQRLQAVLDLGTKPLALDLTTGTGDIITFPDLSEGDTPKEGDIATINGEKPNGDIVIVTNDGEIDLYFVDGVVTAKPENTDMEALAQENADLKAENQALTAKVTAMEKEVKAVLAEMTSEDAPDNKRKPNARAEEKPKSLTARLAETKAKKAGRV